MLKHLNSCIAEKLAVLAEKLKLTSFNIPIHSESESSPAKLKKVINKIYYEQNKVTVKVNVLAKL